MNRLYFALIIVVLIIFFFIYMYRSIPEHFEQSTKKVVLYYSPTCGHCHAFMDTWNKFEMFANSNKNMYTIATKINCSENECKVDGYPTVLLYKSNGDVVQFDKERTFENLLDFVKNNN